MPAVVYPDSLHLDRQRYLHSAGAVRLNGTLRAIVGAMSFCLVAGSLELSGPLVTSPARPALWAQAPVSSAGEPAATSQITDGAESPTTASAVANPQEETLAASQETLAVRYQRFENTLLQLAEYLRKTDPERADLLVRALGRSKEGRIPDQMSQLVELLRREQLGDALERQEAVSVQMLALLELLQSEDRRDEIEKEKARLRDLIRNVERLIGKERDLRAATERGSPLDQLESNQNRIADDTGKLVEKINQQDAARQPGQGNGTPPQAGENPSESAPPAGESPPAETPPGAAPPNEGTPAAEGEPAEPTQNEPQPGEPKPGESTQPGAPANPSSGPPSPPSDSPGQPSPPTPSEGGAPPSGSSSPESPPSSPDAENSSQPGENSSSPATPGRQDLERAREAMQRAIEDLQQQQRGKASDAQDNAIAELIKAKEKLEEILRQLREEERQLLLTQLEARFRDMLIRQTTVYNATIGLENIPVEQRTDRQRARSIQLARDETGIMLLAEKALTLLREAGESVAFPQAIEQLRDDMQTIARRLERVDTGANTQLIERDVIESLEELIEAMQKELEKGAEKKPKPGEPGEPGEPGLVDALAELKLLRQLQFRVNRRTRQLGTLVDGEQAVDPDLRLQLQELAARQAKIQQGTYQLATGQNQ